MKISPSLTSDRILARALVRGIVDSCAKRGTACAPRLRRFRDLQTAMAARTDDRRQAPALTQLILDEIDRTLAGA